MKIKSITLPSQQSVTEILSQHLGHQLPRRSVPHWVGGAERTTKEPFPCVLFRNGLFAYELADISRLNDRSQIHSPPTGREARPEGEQYALLPVARLTLDLYTSEGEKIFHCSAADEWVLIGGTFATYGGTVHFNPVFASGAPQFARDPFFPYVVPRHNALAWLRPTHERYPTLGGLPWGTFRLEEAP